jgi:hypothetical protein
VADNISDQGVVEDRLPEDFRLRCAFDFHESCPHVHPRSKDVFSEQASRFLKFEGNKKPIDVMILWAFAMDRKLNLVRVVFQDFFLGFATGG